MDYIFKAVLSASLYGSLVGVFLIIFKKVIGNRISPRWHYLLWLILIVKLIIPFGPESSYSLFNVFSNIKETEVIENKVEVPSVNLPIENIVDSNEKIIDNYKADNSKYDRNKGVFDTLYSLLAYLWLIIAVIFMLWFVSLNMYVRKKIKQSSSTVESHILDSLNEAKQKLKINIPVQITVQSYISSPSIIGFFRPQIIITKDSRDLNTKDISYIILHELSHHKRGDVVANYVLLMIQAIHWFNPIIWYMFKLIRQDMETATDERVIGFLREDEEKDYARALLKVVESMSSKSFTPKLIGIVDDKKGLEKRIKLLKMSELFKTKRKLITIIGVICIAILSLFLLTNAVNKDNNTLSNTALNEVFDSKIDAKRLFTYKTKYVGDASKVISLLSNLQLSEYRKEVSLETDSKPYGISVKYDFTKSNLNADKIEYNLTHVAILMFSLVDNVDEITFDYVSNIGQEIVKYDRAQLQRSFVKDLREYSKDVESLQILINSLGMSFVTTPKQYTPLMSSAFGIKIATAYIYKSDKIEYRADVGNLSNFNESIISKDISNESSDSYRNYIYWVPKVDGKDISTITVTALINGKIVAERQILIEKIDTIFYRVVDCVGLSVGPKIKTMEEIISLAILDNSNTNKEGEVSTEGHIVLKTEEYNGITTAYLITSSGRFGFENGIFTKVSGTGAIPTVMKLTRNMYGEFSVVERLVPEDGDGYGKSIKKMFPKELHDEVLDNNNNYSKLIKQEEKQAEAYLNSIGRKATVQGNFVQKELAKINVEASNKLSGEVSKYDEFINKCPYWLGTRELLENGERYIYQKSVEKSKDGYDVVVYEKLKQNGELIEQKKFKIIGTVPTLIEE